MSGFQVGTTYKFSKAITLFMKAVMQTKYKGEEGVFTVHEVTPDGSVFTDDITSPVTEDRCKIPADIVEQCEVVTCK